MLCVDGQMSSYFLPLKMSMPTMCTLARPAMSEGDVGSKTIPAQASSIKKNGFAVLKGRPCKIVNTSTSKTGKHGHAKVHMVGIDIFNGKKYEDICPSTHNMEVPVITRAEFQLIDVGDDGFLSLLREDGDTKNDLKLPEGEIGEQIRAAFDEGKDVLCAVQAAMGEEVVVSFKASGGD